VTDITTLLYQGWASIRDWARVLGTTGTLMVRICELPGLTPHRVPDSPARDWQQIQANVRF